MPLFTEALEAFLTQRIVVGDTALPMHYAHVECLEAFQVGFRTHGHTGASLVSETAGDWHPDWYVIALTGLDDPIFIAASEAEQGYPVYTAVHGAGQWNAVRIAPSLERFGGLLQALAAAADDDHFNTLIETEADAMNAFWQEVIEARASAADPLEIQPESSGYSSADFGVCDLIVTNMGPQKLRVVQFVSKRLGLSLKDTLALADALPFTVASGVRKQLQPLADHLSALGAIVELRIPD